MLRSLSSLAFLLLGACQPPYSKPLTKPSAPTRAREALDLTKPEQLVRAWRKVRGSLRSEDEVVFYFSGNVYALWPHEPEARPRFERPLFRIEGFNIARTIDTQQGARVLSREAAFYQDASTGEILECWHNSLLRPARDVRVQHVWNDPVEFDLGQTNIVDLGERVIFHQDVVLSYRSPLAGRPELRPYSAGDLYQGAEVFHFFVARADLEDPSIVSAPAELTWTRVGPLLPWMQLGEAPGHEQARLLYTARGQKLESYEALPARLRAYVAQHKPELAHAPSGPSQGPNATSFRGFARELDEGSYRPECERVSAEAPKESARAAETTSKAPPR